MSITDKIVHDRLLIGGIWRAPIEGQSLDVINPATEEIIGRIPAATAADIEFAVSAARRAFDEGDWPLRPGAERGAILRRIAAGVRERAAELARLKVLDNGKLLGL